MLFLKSFISLQDPGNLLENEVEFELDKETTATFCDDKDEYFEQRLLESTGDVDKSPTEEEHLLGILSNAELSSFGRIPLVRNFILFFSWFASLSLVLFARSV